MKNPEIESEFERWTMKVDDRYCDARQAEYDYDGALPEYEDLADSRKISRRGAVRIG